MTTTRPGTTKNTISRSCSISGRIIVPALLLIVIVTHSTSAQSILASKYPLGLSLNASSGTASSMGGAAVAVQNEYNVLLANPANLGAIEKTVFTSLLTFRGLNIRDGDQRSKFLSVIPEQIAFAFWLGKAGTLGFGIESRTDSRTKYRQVVDLNAEFAGSAELAYSADGGMMTYHAGYGYNLLNKVFLGIGYERYYFNTDQTSFQTSLPDNTFPSTRDSLYVRARGNAVRGGIQVPVWRFVTGLTGEYFFTTDADFVRGVYWGTVSQEQIEDGEFTFQPPPSLKLGVSYQHDTQLLLAGDIGITLWDEMEGEGILGTASRQRAVQFGLGGQYIPAPDLLAPRYWETIRYRAGFRFEQLPDEDDREWGIALGAGFPLQANGLLDAVIEYGRRSSGSYDNYSEEFVRFSVGVNAGRKWTRSSTDSKY